MKSVRQLITIFRIEYISRGINVKDIADNPIDQFEKWIEDAIKKKSENAQRYASCDNRD